MHTEQRQVLSISTSNNPHNPVLARISWQAPKNMILCILSNFATRPPIRIPPSSSSTVIVSLSYQSTTV